MMNMAYCLTAAHAVWHDREIIIFNYGGWKRHGPGRHMAVPCATLSDCGNK